VVRYSEGDVEALRLRERIKLEDWHYIIKIVGEMVVRQDGPIGQINLNEKN